MPITDPTDIATCVLWLAADNITGLSDGEMVETWFDTSGQSNSASESEVSARPTYESNELNGLPVVRFDGVDDRFTFPQISLNDFTLFFVVKATGDCALLGLTGESDPQIRIGQTTDKLSTFDGANNPQSDLLGVSQSQFSIIEFRRSTSTIQFFQNGTAYSSGTMTGQVDVDILGAFVLAVNSLNGDLAECIIYESALDSTNRADIKSYLLSKWFGTAGEGSGIGQVTFSGEGVGYTVRAGSGIGLITFSGQGEGESPSVTTEPPAICFDLNFTDITSTIELSDVEVTLDYGNCN